VAGNTADIAGLTTTVAGNTADIAGLGTAVTGLTTAVAGNTADIADLTTTVGGITTDVAGLAANVAVNTSDIVDLAADVALNADDIADLAVNVAINTGDIATNTTAITNLTTQVAGNTTDITNLTTTVAGNTTDISNLTTTVAGNTTDIANLTTTVAGNTADIADNTSAIANLTTNVAINTGDIADLSVDVANNTTAITNLGDAISNGAIGTVQYSNPATPTVPNGGTPTNDLTLVGATAAPVGLHNVAAGAVAAGSTDAINGGQLFAATLTVQNALTYDTDAQGNRTNTVTLAGGNAAAPVAVNNVAAATLAAGSTGAVNGGQLFATNQAVVVAQTTANSALTLGQNAVQYDAGRTGVTFNPGGTAQVLHNIGSGVLNTDAVNVAQLNSGLSSAVATSNAYTDGRIDALSFDLRSTRRDANAGTAGALAAAGLPQAYEAGKGMVALGAGTYQGASAVAFGFSKAFDDGHTVVKFGATYDNRGKVGANGGVGYQF